MMKVSLYLGFAVETARIAPARLSTIPKRDRETKKPAVNGGLFGRALLKNF
jgi:hypothetical protein